MVLRALSPHYGLMLLFSPANKVGIFILGSVFLATTGAEALYSDMGHVGKRSIYLTWPFVCGALVLNYFGQGAYLIKNLGNFKTTGDIFNPFYEMLPSSVYLFGVLISTIAAIIASQALITGSFTLVEEAVGLKLLPKMKVEHPSLSRGQIYIRTINWSLCICTLLVLVYFRTSERMEAAYGLAITITMLMTTILLSQYLKDKVNVVFNGIFLAVFLSVELIFLISSLTKFTHGGYVTLLITLLILLIMVIWYFGNKLRDYLSDEEEWVSLSDYKDVLQELSNDDRIPLYISNLVMLTKVDKRTYKVKRETLYSILDKSPKKAKVYWFVTVNTTSDPYTNYYTVDMMGTRNIVNLQLYLGFKMDHRVNLYLRQVVEDLIENDIIDEQPQKYTTMPGRKIGDFRFIIIQELLSPNTRVRGWQHLLISARIFIQNHSTNPIQWFGLEFSEVKVEKVPLLLKKRRIPAMEQRMILNPKDVKRSTKE